MTSTNGTTWPGQTEETFPEVFTSMPAQPKKKKPGQLTDDQIKHYFEEGYLLVEDYIPREKLDACRQAINELVEDFAQTLHNAGKIKKLYRDCGLFQRLTMIDQEFPGANMLLQKRGVLPQAFRDLWCWDHLLNLMEQILGTSDIVGNPVWNLRTKTPQNEATTVPWHQDLAYMDSDSYSVLQPAAWIPLLDADESNGCMQVIPRAHSHGRAVTHTGCSGDTHYVMMDEKELKDKLGYDVTTDAVTCPVPYGGMLLINNMIPHRRLLMSLIRPFPGPG